MGAEHSESERPDLMIARIAVLESSAAPMFDDGAVEARGAGLQGQGERKSRIAAAISPACVSSAKWPVSRKRTTAPGMSRLNASAPGGRKNGSFFPHTARSGGLCVRKASLR